ncbi:MAG TPA: 3-phosphoshikimate 1-carboxyvinyltransferase [Bryobacteraceae bacterium]|nr:3-phosphoshikimate 1-carboxyvinyltransferase [Bryobacteraceae bacterium]
MTERISPVTSVRGIIRLPGDKSISHRYAMLGAVAEGTTKIRNYSTGADCQSTLGCVQALGAGIERHNGEVWIHGRGRAGLSAPQTTLDAGNSGSTIRMLSGILAAQPFSSRIAGDESLSRRPMERIMKPLAQMGAHIQARDGKFPPLEIGAGSLHPIDYTLPVASAQVKTCILFGGLSAEGKTIVREPVRTRDHTEIALREFGAEIDASKRVITLTGPARLKAREVVTPGDLSSAAFFIVAALLIPGSNLVIESVGLNPTRSGLLDFLLGMGARIKVLNLEETAGELIGDIEVQYAPVRGGTLEKAQTAALIDEVPVLAVLGAASDQGLTVRDAAELRIKETDRIATIVENLRRMEVEVEESPDGLHVPGRQKFRAAELDSFGDHRIAMAFSVAALASSGECAIHAADAASVSFPEFFNTLRHITA